MTDKDDAGVKQWAVGLSDDEARELAILLDKLSNSVGRDSLAGERAVNYRDKLWSRRRFDRPSGPTGDEDG